MSLCYFNLLVSLVVVLQAFFVFQTSSAKRDRDDVYNVLIRRLVLSPNGTEVNLDVLQELGEFLVDLNSQNNKETVLDVEKSTNSNPNLPHLAINEYLTVGGSPSTTKFLGLSSACDICASIFSVAGTALSQPKIWPSVLNVVKSLCKRSGNLSNQTCDGYVDTFGMMIRYTFPQLVEMPYSVCGKVFSNLGCGTPDHVHSLWQIELPPKPELHQFRKPSKSDGDKFRVLFLSDIHIDPDYEVGSPAICKETMCCRKTSEAKTPDSLPEKDKAGYWGDYRSCDLPIWSFDEVLREINETHGDQIDFIFIGGDLPPHDNWYLHKEFHAEVIDLVASKIAEKFPGKPAFFAMGNHEVSPVNSYSLEGDPEEWSNQWLFDKVADAWSKYLDPVMANATVRKAGFYTAELTPGWRLVSINDNYCLSYNFFMYGRADITDPFGVLSWLVDVLTKAERNGERVHIIGHIPPGDVDCLQAWSWNYYRIISRFSHIITGQFFGHRHKDYFVMYYDAETLTEPASVAFIGPPATPFSQNNIGFRIYDFDAGNFEMLDFHTYYADVEEANASGNKNKMPWRLEYSAKAAYGLADLSPASWSDFARRLQNDPLLFNKYRQHYRLTMNEINEPCGKECRRNRLCEIYQGLSHTPGETWCDRFYKKAEVGNINDNSRKCSARFIKRPDMY